MAIIAGFEKTPKVVVPGAMRELVRGQELDFINRLEPVVKRESVALDMTGVERIDAAGLSALIRLYCDACKTGHEFRVMRPERHVCEILDLMGLERLLACDAANCDARLSATAA